MTASQQTSGLVNLFPQGTGAFVRRRLAELTGAALIAAGAAGGTALFTFHAGDPSLNTATGAAVQNLLGRPGAVTADLGLQIFGVVAALLPLIALAWGWTLLRQRALSGLTLRLLFLLIALVALTLAMAPLDRPETWPLATGLGGITGGLAFDGLARLLALVPVTLPSEWLGSAAAVIGTLSFICALGFSRRDWLTGLGTLAGAVTGTLSAVRTGALWTADTVRRVRSTDPLDLDGPIPADDLDDIDPIAPAEMPARRERAAVDSAPDAGKKGLIARARERKAAKSKKALIAPPAAKPKESKKANRQRTLDLGGDGTYRSPTLDLLGGPNVIQGPAHDPDKLAQKAQYLASVLDDFGVKGEIVKVRPGPVVTLYELEPAPGTKTSRVVGLSDDIARSMSAISVRIAVVPGRSVIGIELPNGDRESVYLRELLASQTFERTKAKLPLTLGKDIGGGPIIADLATMPHLLIAGTTGSGKSVGMNAMVLSLLYRLSPEQCRFIMIDPKMLELSVYEGIPHLLTPVVTDPKKAVVALKWTVREMEERYRAMSQLGVRNIEGYNARLQEAKKKGEVLSRRVQTGFDAEGRPVFEDQALGTDPLPFIVVVVDEMADLMLVAGKDVEASIQRLAQMARAAGIHIMMATQRPSVDVITGTIKANFPTRISFQVTSKIDSRTILGEQGAEQLLGRGDMLYMAGGGRITRVHGPFVSDEEVEQVVSHLKTQGTPEYIEDVTRDDEGGTFGDSGGGNDSGDALYDQAVALVAREGKASTSFVQRHLQIGYNRAARLIERMEEQGVVSPADRVGRREVLVGNH
ncbi:MAG: DNA translocase FtsK 4TM domain-containing protein [Rhodospirillales bacterium]